MEGYDVGAMGHSSADHLHLFAEAGKLAWIDAESYVADPSFVDVPVATLNSKEWASERRSTISMTSAGSPEAGTIEGYAATGGSRATEPGRTAHISVIDLAGNSASITFSLGTHFGSAVTAAGTGILLNEWCCGNPGTINAPEGGKFSRHPTVPTIVLDGDVPILVTGAAGGSRIMLAVIMIISNVVDFGMDVGRAVDAARAQERQCCDLELEEWRVPMEVRAELERRGHTLIFGGEYEGVYALAPTRAQLVAIDPLTGERLAASDPRNERGAVGQE
jgi:gamma-glutamyltranspeptidase/glutathione hydrolase